MEYSDRWLYNSLLTTLIRILIFSGIVTPQRNNGYVVVFMSLTSKIVYDCNCHGIQQYFLNGVAQVVLSPSAAMPPVSVLLLLLPTGALLF